MEKLLKEMKSFSKFCRFIISQFIVYQEYLTGVRISLTDLVLKSVINGIFTLWLHALKYDLGKFL